MLKTAFKSFRAFASKSAGNVAKGMNRAKNNNVIKSMTSGSKKIAHGFRDAAKKGFAGSGTYSYQLPERTKMALSTSNRMPKRALRMFTSTAPKFTVAATAMAALGVMNGAMSQAQDVMIQRYMQDARYSNSVIRNGSTTRSSRGSSLSIGNHVGLSLAMYKTRHGH